MAGKYIECSGIPGDSKCKMVFSAASEEELLQAVVQHAVTVHGRKDTPMLRRMVHKGVKIARPRPGRISPPAFREMVRSGEKMARPRPGRISPPEFREMVRKAG
jgi:predicted small metal-binding protein